jgi:hypothetical protein
MSGVLRWALYVIAVPPGITGLSFAVIAAAIAGHGDPEVEEERNGPLFFAACAAILLAAAAVLVLAAGDLR